MALPAPSLGRHDKQWSHSPDCCDATLTYGTNSFDLAIDATSWRDVNTLDSNK
jgi:hypothetical protein